MEWRTIPDFEAYEVNERGGVRRQDTKYIIQPKGRKVSLWTGDKYSRHAPAELVTMAFAAPEPVEPSPAEEHLSPLDFASNHADELTALRARVAELEAELAVYRVEL